MMRGLIEEPLSGWREETRDPLLRIHPTPSPRSRRNGSTIPTRRMYAVIRRNCRRCHHHLGAIAVTHPRSTRGAKPKQSKRRDTTLTRLESL